MRDETLPFSRRFGYRSPDAEITVREDAPDELREAIVMLADNLGLRPENARLEVCGILLTQPDRNNWTPYPNIFEEVQWYVRNCPWYRVYDIAEGFYSRLASQDWDKGQEFEVRLNEFFRERGIGWSMESGRVVARGSEAFTTASKEATSLMKATGRTTAANEIEEALQDISRRPSADVTGAIQHAMAALECVARDVFGKPNKTLGQLISELDIPKPMDTALEKLWGFASEQGRHIREGRNPRFEEAELVVTVASAVSTYLLRSQGGQRSQD
ncbi:AbiJ-NTD4 domain-containing protein [Microvirga sp. 2TAF3]|uniref:AbiJ-NTD4 domain-containing protein n=1 Tax=Microvirga sp. 2TAF3 TaxID=3233014 RepID=UPI003F9C0018